MIKKISTSLLLLLVCSSFTFAQNTKDKANLPADILNLKNWKLTLPINTEHNGNPDEIKQPELNTFTDNNYIYLNSKKDAVTFKVNAGGETTPGSNFPRTELREMTNDGKTSAAWSSNEGKHTLFIDQRIIHLPEVRKHMVIGQIHDADKYNAFFRIEGSKILMSINGGQKVVINPNYQLGDRFTVKFVVEKNKIECYYNDELKFTADATFTNAYFKAGAYLQSSCKGDKKTEGESCSAYGEVEIYNVWVKHEQ